MSLQSIYISSVHVNNDNIYYYISTYIIIYILFIHIYNTNHVYKNN